MRTIKMIINKQLNWSYNLKEKNKTKIFRIFWSVIFLLKAIKIGLFGILKEQIGSAVVYNGENYTICNWANSEKPTLCGKNGYYKERADRKDIKNILSIKEIKNRFYYMFNWYVSCWLDIDVDKKIYKKVIK